MPINDKQLELLNSGELNNVTANHAARLLQDAAKYDPSILGKMERWKEFYQAGGRENNLLDRLIVEARGGPEGRLPEKVIFGAAQGNEDDIARVQGDALMRDAFMNELIGDFDQGKFEKFRHGQRQQKPALAAELLNEPEVPGGSLRQLGEAIGQKRQNLLDALSTRPR